MIHITYWHWFALALLFMIAETLGASGLLVALGMAAAITGILTGLFSLTLPWGLLIFSIASVACACLWWIFWKKRMAGSKPNLINQPLQAMIGRTAVLVQAIENGQGKIQVNDAYWFVTGPALPEGTTVKIVAVEDTILRIEPVITEPL